MDMLKYIISNETRIKRKKDENERFLQRQKEYKDKINNGRN